MIRRGLLPLAALVAVLLTGCVDAGGRDDAANAQVSSCMLCHNGSNQVDYAGPGMENPHPFPGADNLTCVICHGGNGEGEDKDSSHVPPPPEIGDRANLADDDEAYFNRLTLTGIDKFPDYTVNGVTYSALDYLQFINPGDLRVVTQQRSCGICHQNHADCVETSPLATETGVFSGAMFNLGVDNAVPANAGLHQDTAADLAFRAVSDPGADTTQVGVVETLIEFPIFSVRNANGPGQIDDDDAAYDAARLPQDVDLNTNRVLTGSPLANLYHEQIAFTCGDCHLGSAGANNRYGDFRSSGCTSCHMPKSLDGRSGSRDPNIPRDEPANPDNIREPELSHVRAHRIISTFKTLPNGEVNPGIDDYACAGCHQGSNRTVMQYWGIRLDQNEDVDDGFQYPIGPFDYQTTSGDPRLFDPVVRNNTFNGRNRRQYLLMEDYDNDQRDDTPPDVHYEAGMGCIDCHGSYDLHGGDVTRPGGQQIVSRMEHVVGIQCESCHGGSEGYAATVRGTAFNGQQADLAVDSKGNVLNHVIREADGHFYLYSRLDGRRHYVRQTHDTVVDNQRVHPFTQEALYSAAASYAMGRDDGDAATGLGPHQGGTPAGFKHGDSMDCASCHASWTNTCMGCHLEGEFNRGNNFSNITGQQIVFRERNADFTYQSPVFFQLGVNARGKITQVSPNTKAFFKWRDRQGDFSQVFAFTDRKGNGNNPNHAFPSLGHNAMMAHSIRGKVGPTQEGPRHCVACHLTQDGLDQYGTLYATFKTNMELNQYDQLNFDDLIMHFGQNTGNRHNSPLWVHMVAGLGTGLFLFDENGYPVNPLDQRNNRAGGNNQDSPADLFDVNTMLARTRFNLDRIVDINGVAQGSNNHPFMDPAKGPEHRETAANPLMAGPLGKALVDRLSDPTPGVGIILNSYFDADGNPIGPHAPGAPPPAQTAQQKKKKDDEKKK